MLKPGEYLFKDLEHIIINKPLMEGVFASALYCHKNSYVLELLVSQELLAGNITEEPDGACMQNVGSRIEGEVRRNRPRWPIERAEYYLEINGEPIGRGGRRTRHYRQEPRTFDFGGASEWVEAERDFGDRLLEPTEKGLVLPSLSPQEAIKELLDSESIRETMVEQLMELMQMDGRPEALSERDEKERAFFDAFRKRIEVPAYLQGKSMTLVDLIFQSEAEPKLQEIRQCKWIIESYQENYITRTKLQLPFGEYPQGILLHDEQGKTLTEKILVEGVLQRQHEGENPEGKKEVYIIYETIDNALAMPLFYTSEYLESQEHRRFIDNQPRLQEQKGSHGFNLYKSFAGYIGEQEEQADIELFQMVVIQSCQEEYVLLSKS